MLTYYASGLMDMVISVIIIINRRRGDDAAVVVPVTVVYSTVYSSPVSTQTPVGPVRMESPAATSSPGLGTGFGR